MNGDPASGGSGGTIAKSIGIDCCGTGLPAGRFGGTIGEFTRSAMLRKAVSGRKPSDSVNNSCGDVVASLRVMHAVW